MNNPKVIIYYLALDFERPIVDFTLPHWRRYGHPLIVFTSIENPITKVGDPVEIWGPTGSYGQPMYSRIIELLRRFVTRNDDFMLILEADSFCLLDKIAWRTGLYGTPQFRPYEQAPRFMAERYVTPPYMIDRESAQAMLETVRKYPSVQEEGYSDRLLAALANLSGVPVIPFPEGSWSEAQWTRMELEPGKKDSLRDAVKRGCKWFHLIKTREQFDFVLSLK
jgi:hypothetical protein